MLVINLITITIIIIIIIIIINGWSDILTEGGNPKCEWQGGVEDVSGDKTEIRIMWRMWPKRYY